MRVAIERIRNDCLSKLTSSRSPGAVPNKLIGRFGHVICMGHIMTDRDIVPMNPDKAPDEHPNAKDHGTSHIVRTEGVGRAVGTSVGGVTGAAAGAAVGALGGPGGMALGALVGAGLGALGGKLVGDPVNSEIEKRDDPEGPSGEEGSGGGSSST
jgi:hypothetical protein